MGRSSKISEKEEELIIEAEIKAEMEAENKVVQNLKSFGIEEATKLASSFIPKDDKETSNYNVMYVASDKSVFFKSNEGLARRHAIRNKLELFTVKPVKK